MIYLVHFRVYRIDDNKMVIWYTWTFTVTLLTLVALVIIFTEYKWKLAQNYNPLKMELQSHWKWANVITLFVQCSYSDSITISKFVVFFFFFYIRSINDYDDVTFFFVCVIHQSSFVCFSSGHLFINSIFRFFLSFIRFRAHSGATLFFAQ